MITEEALPTYMSMINTLDGVRDESGASDTPWANWTRAWTAEENRHGDVMNKYMWLTGESERPQEGSFGKEPSPHVAAPLPAPSPSLRPLPRTLPQGVST